MYQELFDDLESIYETNKFNYKYVRYDRKPPERLVSYYKDTYNINTDCHFSCVSCQIHQINKYKTDLELKNEKLIAATGKGLEKWFPVKCDFIKKGLPNSFFEKLELLKNKGIEEKKAKRLLLASIDPAAWAETMFGFNDETKELPDINRHWYLRWYQKLIVRCTANRIVLRWGRRCVEENTLILKEDGTYSKIKDIKVGDMVISYNKEKDIFEPKPVLNVFNNGVQKVYQISTTNHEVIEVTSNHPLLKVINIDHLEYLKYDWKSLETGLDKGRPRIATIAKSNIFGNQEFYDEAVLLGYLLTDGCLIRTQTPKFVSKDYIYIEEVKEKVKKIFDYNCNLTYKGGAYRLSLTDGDKRTPNKIHTWAEKLKISGLKSHNKVVPLSIWQGNKKTVALFINRMFSGDGCIYIGKPRFPRNQAIEATITSCSYALLKDIKLLLFKFGVCSKVIKENTRNNWKLKVNGANNIIRLFDNIGFIYGKEKKSIEAYEIAKKIVSTSNTSDKVYNGKLLPKIKSIKEIGYKQTYDIEVMDNHSFIGNNIINHNSGKSAISTLWMINKIFNYKVFKGVNPETGEDITGGPAIAIVTPFQSQVSNLFEELERFIKSNKELEKQVVPRGSKLYRQTPPLLMEFKNGASIKGFVTGSNNKEDGSGGGAIRGLTADIVYLDEMDMIPESIYKKVIDPLKLSKPFTYFIGSSTPIGKKATFYKWSLEDMNYKESYVPSTALPHWDIVEEEAINESTQDSFRSEYMADFITDSYGAFKNHYIVSARTNYSYKETNSYEFWKENFGEDFSKFRICIGIDWNKKVGTEYSVTAWSPLTGEFWVLENLVLPPSQYSGQAYKETLKTLNFKWNPHYIYADEGYGHFLIEDLQVESAYAQDDRAISPFLKSTAELGKKMKTINFSSNIKLYNPASGTYFEKYAKSFLVENAVQIFEREKIHFDESDQVLIKQLGNYIEIKKQDNGRIVYGMENELIGDHRLDALMLSLGGLVIEESLYSPNFNTETGTFLKERQDNEKETFVSAIQQATELKSLIKRQKTNASFQGIVLQRGSTRDQEYNNWKEKQWKEGLTNPTRSGKIPIDSEKASKGFFSKHGLATYSETSPGEDKEENWKYSSPIKVASGRTGNHIRRSKF